MDFECKGYAKMYFDGITIELSGGKSPLSHCIQDCRSQDRITFDHLQFFGVSGDIENEFNYDSP